MYSACIVSVSCSGGVLCVHRFINWHTPVSSVLRVQSAVGFTSRPVVSQLTCALTHRRNATGLSTPHVTHPTLHTSHYTPHTAHLTLHTHTIHLTLRTSHYHWSVGRSVWLLASTRKSGKRGRLDQDTVWDVGQEGPWDQPCMRSWGSTSVTRMGYFVRMGWDSAV